MKTPHIKTALPGPKAEAMIERDALVVSPSYPRDYPFVMSHAQGAEAWDVDGNRFLDFVAGIAVCATGHSIRQVVQAITEAAEKFLHISSDYWHEGQVALAREDHRARSGGRAGDELLLPERHRGGGSRAEARALRHGPRALHRLSSAASTAARWARSSFTSSKYTQQKGFFPTMPGVTHVPYPNPYRPLFAGDDQGAAVLDYIEKVLFRANVPASEVAAILVEPIQGEGGYLVPPDGFLQGLRALCDRHGILLIFDEVQSGIGRTRQDVRGGALGRRPDIMTLAKGIGSGLPIGMVVAKKALMEQWRAARMATRTAAIRVLRGCARDARSGRARVHRERARVGEYFIGRLRELQGRYDCIGDVRGKGLDARHGAGQGPQDEGAGDEAERPKLITRAFHNGLLLLIVRASTVRFMPPLMITNAHVDEAIAILEASLGEAQNA